MPKQTEIDLNLLDGEELMQELMRRYEQIIIIRENRKESDIVDIKIKTCRGKFCKPEDDFDIILAQDLLMTAHEHLLKAYMGLDEDDNEGADSPQNSQEGC